MQNHLVGLTREVPKLLYTLLSRALLMDNDPFPGLDNSKSRLQSGRKNMLEACGRGRQLLDALQSVSKQGDNTLLRLVDKEHGLAEICFSAVETVSLWLTIWRTSNLTARTFKLQGQSLYTSSLYRKILQSLHLLLEHPGVGVKKPSHDQENAQNQPAVQEAACKSQNIPELLRVEICLSSPWWLSLKQAYKNVFQRTWRHPCNRTQDWLLRCMPALTHYLLKRAFPLYCSHTSAGYQPGCKSVQYINLRHSTASTFTQKDSIDLVTLERCVLMTIWLSRDTWSWMMHNRMSCISCLVVPPRA